MEESVLDSTKKILGLDANYNAFDQDVLTFLNSALNRLRQLGYPSAVPGGVGTSDLTWAELFPGEEQLADIKNYIYLRVRLAYDPPDKPHHVAAMKEQREELEYELMTERRVRRWGSPSSPSLP